MNAPHIREAFAKDFEMIWPFFKEIVRAGDTYAYPPDISKSAAFDLWMLEPQKTFIICANNAVLGSYFIKKNHAGPGQHVCNCGYMVSPKARGQGLATTMCEHSQIIAQELGYKAMQFNFVAASNQGAIRLWTKLGFETVGRLPKAFNHPTEGFIDALIMYKWLNQIS